MEWRSPTPDTVPAAIPGRQRRMPRQAHRRNAGRDTCRGAVSPQTGIAPNAKSQTRLGQLVLVDPRPRWPRFARFNRPAGAAEKGNCFGEPVPVPVMSADQADREGKSPRGRHRAPESGTPCARTVGRHIPASRPARRGAGRKSLGALPKCTRQGRGRQLPLRPVLTTGAGDSSDSSCSALSMRPSLTLTHAWI